MRRLHAALTSFACFALVAAPAAAGPKRPVAPPPAATPAPAPAPAPDAYGDAKRKGDDALVAGRLAEALASYREAYAVRPEVALLYNMGRTHQLLGEYPAALDDLERFESTAPADIRAKVPGLANLIADVRRHIATVAVASDVDGATVRIGDRTFGQTPLPTVVRTAPGTVTVLVTKDGYFPFSRVLELKGGAITTVDARLASRQTTAILVVRSPVAGTLVALDGKPEGTVPSELVVNAGRHRLALSHPGYVPAETSVVVAAGDHRMIDVPLEREQPLTKKWWFWTGVGVVAVGATITVIALTTEKDPGSGTVAPGRISAGLRF